MVLDTLDAVTPIQAVFISNTAVLLIEYHRERRRVRAGRHSFSVALSLVGRRASLVVEMCQKDNG